ncbi:MAG: acyl carrier protein [Acutalibacteraceae bacterium]|nr:acyl carrier protein [Acutalibacteraceae bacterium]
MLAIEKLIEILENYVEADEIKGEDCFKSDLGLSSFDTMCLVNDIKAELGVSLQAKDFIEHKTVGDMAEYISTLK